MLPPARSPIFRLRVEWGLRVCALVLFAGLASRSWHAYYGFTSLLQIDAAMAARAVPAIRDQPVFADAENGPYDGGYYAQLATDPSLRDPALRAALDAPAYRAQRILLPALAWVLGRGEAVASVQAYAWLNLPAWFALALLLWRVLPPGQRHATLAWFLLLFSAGILLSFRLALTDLPALVFLAAAVILVERGRLGAAGGWLAAAALTRETAVLGTAALLPDGQAGWRAAGWARRLTALAVVAVPLAAWQLYVRDAWGAPGSGIANFAWPLAGWAERWIEFPRRYAGVANPILWIESVLEHVALTVQAIYLVRHRRPDCPWWRTGAATLLLGLVLGTAVWEGFPNAASRLLLPVTLAFHVRVFRDRASLGWLLAGNLALFAGIHALAVPAGTPRILPAPSSWAQACVLETDDRWALAEWTSERRWAWCGDSGGLCFRVQPGRPAVRLELELRGVTPRTVEVSHAGRVVWRGPIGDRPQWISLPELPLVNGRLDLELRSDSPALVEGPGPTARRISFACFGSRLAE